MPRPPTSPAALPPSSTSVETTPETEPVSSAFTAFPETSMLKENLRILLVEDHPFQLIATQILLNNHGFYRLTPAMTASEAMMALERSATPYDLLLCDQGLPDLSGLDLIEAASRRGLIVQAVVFSGLAQSRLDDLQLRAAERGLPLLGCLSKPLFAPDLSRLLSQARRDACGRSDISTP
jgi:CheY-like chemotaxis protein